MPQGEFVAGWFTPLEKPSFPGGKPPIVKPPLPPGLGGLPTPPIELPPEVQPPIFLPDTPEHPIVLPPGTVWPPLNPGDGLFGKMLLLAWVPGVGFKWVVVDLPEPPAGGIGGTPPPRPGGGPMEPQPKR